MRRKRIARKVWYALIPVTGLLLFAEVIVRVSGIADSKGAYQPLPVIAQPDPDLFWSHTPNQHRLYMGATVTINNLGLRGAEITPKRDGEFRILSLGESTSFGLKVADDETYAAVLQRHLNEHAQTDRFNVINAGIGAYTSFQSLMYLKLRGLDLEPDMVLFYHEYNDYLPTQVRDSEDTVIGLSLTDQQRYDSAKRKRHRKLLSVWATYRAAHNLVAQWRISRFERAQRNRGPGHWRTMTGVSITMDTPHRVSLAERVANFEALRALSEEHDFRLVVIHPSYRQTSRHECELTEFCRDRQVTMFEAHDALHPPDMEPDELFCIGDGVHPNADGHRRVGTALGQFLMDRKLVPDRR